MLLQRPSTRSGGNLVSMPRVLSLGQARETRRPPAHTLNGETVTERQAEEYKVSGQVSTLQSVYTLLSDLHWCVGHTLRCSRDWLHKSLGPSSPFPIENNNNNNSNFEVSLRKEGCQRPHESKVQEIILPKGCIHGHVRRHREGKSLGQCPDLGRIPPHLFPPPLYLVHWGLISVI